MTKRTGIACHQCQSVISYHIHGELPSLLHRKVAQHLSSCVTCEQRFRREQDFARQLAVEIPCIGRGHRPAYDAIWESIECDVFKSQPRQQRLSTRYGLVALGLVLALLLPWMMLGRGTALVLAQEPIPVIEAATQIPLRTESAARVALDFNETVQQTSALNNPPNAVPVPGATQSP